MTPSQAQAVLRKLYGKRAAWRYNDRALYGEQREALEVTLGGLRVVRDAAKQALDARRAELLRDPEYVRLQSASIAANKMHDLAISDFHSRRVTVGYSSGMFFHVTGQGDNWHDAVEKAKLSKMGSPP